MELFQYFRQPEFDCGKAEIQLKIKILSIDSCLEIKGSYSSEYLRATDDRFVILIEKFCENLIWYFLKLFPLFHCSDLRTFFVFALGLSVPSQDGKVCPRILVLHSYYKGDLAPKLR